MKHSRLYTLLHEPLLHFLIIGAALFFLFSQVNTSTSDNDNQIVISPADLDTLASAWLKRMGRPPTAQEREQQLEHYIHQQVLYREAIKMGLQQNDVIIQRRLAQKMEYLFNDLSFISEPTDAELQKFLSTHRSDFTLPAMRSFKQIYLDPEQHKNNISNEIMLILKQLNTGTNAIGLGDRSLLPFEFTNETEKTIASMFGNSFASRLFAFPATDLENNNWQGPIKSEYGTHLIQIKTANKEHLPALPEIHDRVSTRWYEDKREQANKLFYQSLYQRYEIIVDDEVMKSIVTRAKQ